MEVAANTDSPPVKPRHPLWSGADPRIWKAGLAIRAELPWLEAFFPQADSPDYYFWVVNFALREGRQGLAGLLPPLPGAERMQAIAGSYDVEAFLNVGTQTTAAILDLLTAAGHDPFARRRILDFGCGCARVLRHLLPLAGSSELVGADIDAAAIDYCSATIPGARFLRNSPEPPLPAPAGAFDLIYSISVFTHLARPLQEAWVGEFHRLLAPGGLAAVTVHGELAWRKVESDSTQRELLGLDRNDIDRASPSWRRDGFAFVDHIVPGAYEHDEPYGLVFLQPGAMAELWRGFRVVAHRPGAISEWQDLVLLERT